MGEARKGLTAMVLAAGLSRRAAPHHKLLLERDGRPILRTTVEAILAAGCGEVIVVTGHAREAIAAVVEDLPVRCVWAPDFALGMGHSLAFGVAAARADTTGYLISVGDLPGLSAGPVEAVVAAFLGARPPKHVVPTCRGQRGHPVLVGGWLRDALCSLEGDVGARQLLAREPEVRRVRLLEVGDPAIFQDLDFGLDGRG